MSAPSPGLPLACTPCENADATESPSSQARHRRGPCLVPQARFLRVVSFRPGVAESAFDASLRAVVVPRLLDDDLVVDAWVGRHGTRDDQSRVLASTWTADPEADRDAEANDPVDVA